MFKAYFPLVAYFDAMVEKFNFTSIVIFDAIKVFKKRKKSALNNQAGSDVEACDKE